MGRDAEDASARARPAEGRDHDHLRRQQEIRSPGADPAAHGLVRSLRGASGGSLRMAQAVQDGGALVRRGECQMGPADPDAVLRARRRIHRPVPGLFESASEKISNCALSARSRKRPGALAPGLELVPMERCAPRSPYACFFAFFFFFLYMPPPGFSSRAICIIGVVVFSDVFFAFFFFFLYMPPPGFSSRANCIYGVAVVELNALSVTPIEPAAWADSDRARRPAAPRSAVPTNFMTTSLLTFRGKYPAPSQMN